MWQAAGVIFAETGNYIDSDLASLFIIVLIAAVVPLLVGLFRIKIAEVVILIALGVIVGPQLLGWVHLDAGIELFSEIGLGFLFFIAGMELDRRVLKGRTGKLAATGWLMSLLFASAASFVLLLSGTIQDFLGIAIALTSTALGTLLPVIRDSGRLRSKFGENFMAAGAWGEFGPLLAISILLSTVSVFASLIVLVVFAVIAIAVALAPKYLGTERVKAVLARGHDTSAQTAVRITVLVLIGLLAVADRFGLDVVLGAFIAGVIVRQYAPSKEESPLQSKIESLAFGLFIPIFFVVTGAKLDVRSIVENPSRLVVFFFLLLLCRGVPQFIVYFREFPAVRERLEYALFVATALPIVVAVTTVEVNAGVMLPSNAAAMVGAAACTVLIFPLLGATINKSAQLREVLNA